MEGSENHRAISIGHSQGIVVTAKAQIFKDSSVKNVLVLIDELIISVDRACTVDQADRIIGKIQIIGQFDIIEDNVEIRAVYSCCLEGNIGQI